jgi:hypothetical protein
VRADLAHAITNCAGALTAPPRAVTSSLLLGEEAIPALTDYIERDVAYRYGAATFVAAVVRELGGGTTLRPDERDRRALVAMVSVAKRLQSELGTG